MHGQCDARPTVTFPATQCCHPLTGTKLYCLINKGTCVWTTCPRLLPGSAPGGSRTATSGLIIVVVAAKYPNISKAYENEHHQAPELLLNEQECHGRIFGDQCKCFPQANAFFVTQLIATKHWRLNRKATTPCNSLCHMHCSLVTLIYYHLGASQSQCTDKCYRTEQQLQSSDIICTDLRVCWAFLLIIPV